jgi:hypothetical protein
MPPKPSTLVLDKLVKDNFPCVESLKRTKRGKKLYLTIKLREWSLDNHKQMLEIKDALRDMWPRIYMTSFGGGSATFRLNNLQFPIDTN